MAQIVAHQQVFNVDSDIADALNSARLAAERMDGMGMGKKKTMPVMEEEEYDEDEEYVEDSDDLDDEDLEDEDDDEDNDTFEASNVLLDGLEELLERADADDFRDVLDHIDSLEAAIAMLKRHSDSDEPESVEALVSERIDGILTAYEAAKPYLNSEFKLDGTCTPHSIYTAALQHRIDGLEIKWDSKVAVETAFEMLKQDSNSVFAPQKTVTVADALVPRTDMGMTSNPGRKLKPCTYSKDS
jgi:hypothetical protein